eukprot:CAMPEP_0204587208 /NCGR_PEP_ID=MMETSP0661-20131031/47926_1 /ASSEMBLY_ACC=CAM_ASM_000606 /TAXON_ID=109239 /ORGANISM="Alexandrium margalefi, Strain AMGDE01CS-322" /LENGTH=70 /DNA_ID=CAMNT_0051596911 /DNA_START=582 /DNA_END=792 /DNA_ORIENTATION=-
MARMPPIMRISSKKRNGEVDGVDAASSGSFIEGALTVLLEQGAHCPDGSSRKIICYNENCLSEKCLRSQN